MLNNRICLKILAISILGCCSNIFGQISGSWSIVILPDTQEYASHWNYQYGSLDMFKAQTQWIVANKDARNIQVVLHEGDFVNFNDYYVDQWAASRQAMSILDNKIPYVVSTGNHDYHNYEGMTPQLPDTRDGTYLNDYYKASYHSCPK